MNFIADTPEDVNGWVEGKIYNNLTRENIKFTNEKIFLQL
jgi:hypothetical protein